jgi:hypothetical protein
MTDLIEEGKLIPGKEYDIRYKSGKHSDTIVTKYFIGRIGKGGKPMLLFADDREGNKHETYIELNQLIIRPAASTWEDGKHAGRTGVGGGKRKSRKTKRSKKNKRRTNKRRR